MKYFLIIFSFLVAIGLIAVGFYIGRNGDSIDQVTNSSSNELSDQGLTKFPTNILSDKNLEILDLSDNSLEFLPSEIGELTNLEELNVSGNNLTGALPGEIRKMKDLRILNASNNSLTGIPAEIGQLNKLIELDLSNNEIRHFPERVRTAEWNIKET